MPASFYRELGKKLKTTREKLGLTQEEVRISMGLESQVILSNIESGTRQLKANELSKLAKIYFKNISFFLGSEEEMNEREPLVCWRECGDTKLAKIKEQEFLKFCNNYYELEKRLGLKYLSTLNLLNYKPDDYNFDKIEDITNDLYNEMKLGSRPACSLRKILEEKYNIKIFYYDLEGAGSAASSVGCFGSAVLINSSEPLWRRNYDLAHELFHILTWNTFKHQDVHVQQDGKKSIVEKYADAFASSLLLPQDDLRREFNNIAQDDKIDLVDLVGIAREFEVSTQALLWRLVTLKLLDRSVVRQVLGSVAFIEIDAAERVKDHRAAPDISEKYNNLVYKAYMKGLITKGKLAQYLNINIGDVEMRMAKLGYKMEEQFDGKIATS